MCYTFISDCSPPPFSGQSVGGALTSAKSAMSSWFSTLAQPSAATGPACPEPATEVQPWNQTQQSWLCPRLRRGLRLSGVTAALMKDVSRKSLQNQFEAGTAALDRKSATIRVHIHCEAETASAIDQNPGCCLSLLQTLKTLLLGVQCSLRVRLFIRLYEK